MVPRPDSRGWVQGDVVRLDKASEDNGAGRATTRVPFRILLKSNATRPLHCPVISKQPGPSPAFWGNYARDAFTGRHTSAPAHGAMGSGIVTRAASSCSSPGMTGDGWGRGGSRKQGSFLCRVSGARRASGQMVKLP